MIFRCSGFRRLGKPSSSLKVTFINGAYPDFFRKKFRYFLKNFIWRGNRDEADKKAKKLQIIAKASFLAVDTG
ncbi:hypothetical protein LA59_13310 [Vibrio harveyi]|nr:hypothetical protein LA59_13310 [Vibrio harveyi]APP05345.1 hypothetical protein BG259_08285 [Vibrio harveyi]ODM58380.1 hypothetical protein BC455_14615 [Vibrio harveyi]GEA22023.1 hypothetical protein VH1807_contig00021-0112 [Vibrio harveyi]